MPSEALLNLGREIKRQMKHGDDSAMSRARAETGTITAEGLKLDKLNQPLPDYLVSEQFDRLDELLEMVQTIAKYIISVHTIDGGFEDLEKIIEYEVEPLKAGDRVIALPVNAGNNYVVVGRV